MGRIVMQSDLEMQQRPGAECIEQRLAGLKFKRTKRGRKEVRVEQKPHWRRDRAEPTRQRADKTKVPVYGIPRDDESSRQTALAQYVTV